MSSLRERFEGPGRWNRAVGTGAIASLGYTALVCWYSARPASDVVITGSIWQFVGLYSLLAFGTVGVPLALWVRYGIRAPAVLLALVLLFWHVLVFVPPLGSGEGDAPGFTFVFLFAPAYLVAYGLLAGGEHWLRGRATSLSSFVS